MDNAAPVVVADAVEEAPVVVALVVVPVAVVPLPAEAAAGVVAAVGPGTIEVVFKHVVDDPGFTVKGADCATVPELSRRVRPRETPA